MITNSLFHGVYEIPNDSGRVTIPAGFRKIIHKDCGAGDAGLLIHCAADGIMRAFPQHLSRSTETADHSDVVRLDAKGRIRLPASIIERLRIEKSETVILNGMGDCFELWSARGWVDAQRQAERDLPVT